MQAANFLKEQNFPIIYEADKPTAVVVDIESFRRIELILDNLLNREGEPEDELIASAADLWMDMVAEVDKGTVSVDWLTELNDL